MRAKSERLARRLIHHSRKGYRNRVKLISRAKTVIDNPSITKHVKRNRVHRLVKQSSRRILTL